MGFIEIAKKTGRGLALSAALLAAGSLAAIPGTAYARDWHGGGGHWGHHHGGPGPGLVLGLLAGGFAGAAIASAANPYNYNYGYPAYGYAPATPYYAPYGSYSPY
jgi:hypothetical protein